MVAYLPFGVGATERFPATGGRMSRCSIPTMQLASAR
jgi:hypothetical protein